MRLQGRVAIVTGAASGIGKASAELFANEGARVFAVDLKPFTSNHENIETFAKDVTDNDAATAIVEGAVERYGQLDILMNNAGVGMTVVAPLEFLDDEKWDTSLSVNLTSCFKLSKAASPYLKKSSAGRIINVASVMAEGANSTSAAYSAAKAGVAGLTRSLAMSLGKDDVLANYILPGAVKTGMTEEMFKNDRIAQGFVSRSSLKRLAEPIDIARAALFLASDDCSFVTGHGLVVDGGMLVNLQ